jgi:hypothetical protein
MFATLGDIAARIEGTLVLSPADYLKESHASKHGVVVGDSLKAANY